MHECGESGSAPCARTTTRRLATCLLGIALLFANLPATANPTDGDLRLWSEFLVAQHRGPRWTSYTWAELRFIDDIERLGTVVLQQKLYRRFSPTFAAGVGAATIRLTGRTGTTPHMERVELDAVPRWRLGARNAIELRARLEQRWWQPDAARNGIVARARLRWHRNFDGPGPLRRLEVSNEFFRDEARHCYCENRLRIAELHFRLAPRYSGSTFLQVRSLRSGAGQDWDHALVLGVGLRFNGGPRG